MGKHLTLSQRIAERVAKSSPNKKAKNKAAFLANKTEIEGALTDGWSMRLIWDTLYSEKKINVSYQAFTKQVGRLIPGWQEIRRKNAVTKTASPVPAETPRPQETATREVPAAEPTSSEPVVVKTESTKFNFSSQPDKANLV